MFREIILLGVGAIFGLGTAMTSMAAPSYFPNMPSWVWYWLFWGGIALMALMVSDAICVLVWRPRLATALLANIALIFAAAAAISQFSPAYSTTQIENGPMIARLAELGWTVKANKDDILFEFAGGPLPSMQESSKYFSQLNKPFRLHFQSVKSLEGLHFLSDVRGCTSLEINAGEFTDISELRGFSQLTKLVISQVPLSGVGTVDASALSSLVNLRELGLEMTRIRNVDFIPPLKNLKTLWLGQTLVADIAPLSGLASLEFLDIRGTRATDLSPLSKHEKLAELIIGGEQVPNLAQLGHLKNLKKILIIEQQRFDSEAISSLINLESLSIFGPQYVNFSPLRKLSKLRELHVSGFGIPFGTASQVVDVLAIRELLGLKTLTLGSLQISDLAFVDALKNLDEINLNGLPVVSVEPLRGLKSLKKVSLVQTLVVDVSPLLDLTLLAELNVLRTPARADVLTELERRGVRVMR